MRNVFSSRKFAGVLLTGLAAAPLAAAQSPAFEALKKAHTAEISKTVQSLREGYIRALLNLEQTLASKGDYAGARQAQKERREMEQLAAGAAGANRGAAVSLAKDGSVLLTPVTAETAAGARLDDSKKYLGGWNTAGASARWILPPGLPEGGYDLEISCNLSPASGKGAGLFQIKEDFYTLSRSLTPAEPGSQVTVPAGAAPLPSGESPPLLVGPLRLRSNASSLEIKALTPEPGCNLQIRSIRLIPAASSSSDS